MERHVAVQGQRSQQAVRSLLFIHSAHVPESLKKSMGSDQGEVLSGMWQWNL